VLFANVPGACRSDAGSVAVAARWCGWLAVAARWCGWLNAAMRTGSWRHHERAHLILPHPGPLPRAPGGETCARSVLFNPVATESVLPIGAPGWQGDADDRGEAVEHCEGQAA